MARRCDGLGAATSPGTRASGGARPTGVLLSAAESIHEDVRGSSNSSTLRWLGCSDESRNAGVGRSPTHGGSSQRCGIRSRGCSWVEQQLDAAMAWVQRRLQERGRRAEPDPRRVFSALRNPFTRMFVGRATARRCDGLGAATTPGTRASGGARPTGGLLSAAESIHEDVRGSSNSSTPRGLGYSDESRNAGVGRSPTHGGSSQRCGARSRRCWWVEQQLDAAMAWVRRVQERGRRAEPDPRTSGAMTTAASDAPAPTQTGSRSSPFAFYSNNSLPHRGLRQAVGPLTRRRWGCQGRPWPRPA